MDTHTQPYLLMMYARTLLLKDDKHISPTKPRDFAKIQKDAKSRNARVRGLLAAGCSFSFFLFFFFTLVCVCLSLFVCRLDALDTGEAVC
jgi:hypothetical protein